MAEIRKRTRLYEPWGYQDENNYQSSEIIAESDLESFFAGTSYDKDSNMITFTNKDGKEVGSLDVSEFVKSDSIIEKTEYSHGILKIYFTNGDIITIDLTELVDENEFKDGLVVDNHEVKVLVDSNGEPYLSVSEDGVKISGVDAAIQVETDRATAAEEALDAKIEAETARATAAEEALDTKIENEITRATAAEEALDAKIDAETARATAAEQALQTALDQEIADRIADVDAEETRAKAAEQALQTALTNEITRATHTEQQLNHRINMVNDELDSEEARALAAEQELRTNLNSEINNRIADVDAEETRAKAAEQALQDAIDTEEARAMAAEQALQTAITNEVTRATAAEQALDAKIDQEIADRTADVDAEEARATAAEEALDAKINNVESALTDAVAAEEARATAAEEALDDKIDAETTRATAAENDLQTAIDQEVADRIADVNAEETRAMTKEAELENAINNLGNNKFDDAVYDSSAKTINFFAEGAVVATIDATDFIKDGMVDRVYIDTATSELVIVWNTESGKEETRIPLSDIFDPSNYYTKDEIDDKVDTINSAITVVEGDITDIQGDIVNINSAITSIQGDIATIEGDITNINSSITVINESIEEMKDQYGDDISALTDSVRELEETVENDEFTISMALNDLNTRKLDASAYTPTDLSNYYTKDETSGKTEIADALDNFYTKEEIDEADRVVSESLNDLNTRINAHTADTDIHVTSADKTAWNAKADVSDIPSVAPYADSVKYNSTTHFVEFYHGTTAGTKVFEYDASPFLVDGMVESVEVKTITSGGSEVKVLEVTWNSAAGGQVTDIPLGDLFDPSLYYTKEEIDEADRVVATALNDLDSRIIELDERKLDASAYTPTDLSNYYTKSEVDARDLWVSGSGTNSAVLKGGNNVASGSLSVAEGEDSVASGRKSHAEGYGANAGGDGSHAEGNRTVASGTFAHTEGNTTSATTTSSHAEGGSTLASGINSHAEGDGTNASGEASHAEGVSTISSNRAEHASGKYNVSNSNNTPSGDTLFSVGNGTDVDARHNAFEIRENGDIYITINGNDVLLQNFLTQLQDFVAQIDRVTARALIDLDSRLKTLEG